MASEKVWGTYEPSIQTGQPPLAAFTGLLPGQTMISPPGPSGRSRKTTTVEEIESQLRQQTFGNQVQAQTYLQAHQQTLSMQQHQHHLQLQQQQQHQEQMLLLQRQMQQQQHQQHLLLQHQQQLRLQNQPPNISSQFSSFSVPPQGPPAHAMSLAQVEANMRSQQQKVMSLLSQSQQSQNIPMTLKDQQTRFPISVSTSETLTDSISESPSLAMERPLPLGESSLASNPPSQSLTQSLSPPFQQPQPLSPSEPSTSEPSHTDTSSSGLASRVSFTMIQKQQEAAEAAYILAHPKVIPPEPTRDERMALERKKKQVREKYILSLETFFQKLP